MHVPPFTYFSLVLKSGVARIQQAAQGNGGLRVLEVCLILSNVVVVNVNYRELCAVGKASRSQMR